MRVVHVHRMRGIGGSERHVLTLLPALARLGVEPAFVGLDDLRGWDPGPFYAELDAAGVAYARLRSPRRLPRALRTADVVHTHLVHADVFGALAAGRRTLVSTKHNDDRFRTGPFRLVERALARRAARVICITEALRRFNVERVGLPAEKLVTIPYGLDELPPPWGPSPELALPEDARVLLCVSRLEPQKGVDVAVRALALVRREHPDAVLVVLGAGPERERLAAEGAHLPGRVGDVAAWYRRAELLVHPARWEGFGLAVLEAMLAGLPVVASRVSSLPELVVDGETGLLVAPGDHEALAAAIARLLADAELRRRLGAAGRARARSEFTVERMARATLGVYEAALRRT